MNTTMSSRFRRAIALVIVGVGLTIVPFASAVAQTMFISTIGDNTGTIALFKPDGEDFKKFALAEIKGQIEFGAAGISKGEDSFLRLQTLDTPDKWLKIVKRELVKGKLVITTEEKKVFTIFDLQGNYLAKIVPGRPGPEVDEPATKDDKAKKPTPANVVELYLAAAAKLDVEKTRSFLAARCDQDIIAEIKANAASGWRFDPKQSTISSKATDKETGTATVIADMVHDGGGTFMAKKREFSLILEKGVWKISGMTPPPASSGPGVRPLR